MELKNQLIINVINLIDDLNNKAETSLTFIPSCNLLFSLKIKFPFAAYNSNEKEKEKIKGVHVFIIISYLSGGSIESSYMINDRISFIITDEKITGIIFEKEGIILEDKKNEIFLNIENIKYFFDDLKSFCQRFFKDINFC